MFAALEIEIILKKVLQCAFEGVSDFFKFQRVHYIANPFIKHLCIGTKKFHPKCVMFRARPKRVYNQLMGHNSEGKRGRY